MIFHKFAYLRDELQKCAFSFRIFVELRKDLLQSPANPLFWHGIHYRFVICAYADYILKSMSCQEKDWQGPALKSIFWNDNEKDPQGHDFVAVDVNVQSITLPWLL